MRIMSRIGSVSLASHSCRAVAHSRAATIESNTANTESPAVSTTRPPWVDASVSA